MNSEKRREQVKTECPDCGREVALYREDSFYAGQCVGCDCLLRLTARQPGEGLPTDASGEPETEEEVLTVHPAMLRGHPRLVLLYVVLLAACILGLAGWNPVQATEQIARIVNMVCWAIVALLVLGLPVWWLSCRATSLAVTNRRLILSRGIIAKRVHEVLHRDIKTIQVEQKVLQRLLFTGDLAVGSAGHSGLEIFVKGLPNPTRVTELIRQYQPE
jgi:hypothetical protein